VGEAEAGVGKEGARVGVVWVVDGNVSVRAGLCLIGHTPRSILAYCSLPPFLPSLLTHKGHGDCWQ